MSSSVSVALCTYNGGKHLREQLDSIARQSWPPDELVVCDDRSTDDTVEIVRSFASERGTPFPVSLHVNETILGAKKNFERAIELCLGNYVALSDQDDVWLPQKLQITLDALQGEEEKRSADTPLLVHTDLEVIDASCHTLSPSFREHQGFKLCHGDPLAELLVENYVTGCTLMMNRALRDAALPIPQEASMHDWWIALVAASLGYIVSLPETTVLYRQHPENVLGARKRDIKKYVLGWGSFAHKVQDKVIQNKALAERYKGNSTFLQEYTERASGGGFRGVYWMATRGVRMQSLSRTLALYLLLAAKVGVPG